MIVRQQLVTSTARTYGTGNRRRTVTIHNTGNENPGAGAAAHANLQTSGNVRQASWHWQVDDREAVQSYTHITRCWHAGDGKGPGNYDSIAIEICMNPDSHWATAVRNAAELCRQILAQEGLTVANVVQHNHWSGKNCPARLRAGYNSITWGDFLDMVATPPVLGSRVLKVRDQGVDVKDLQRRLNALPSEIPERLDDDGDYYTLTAGRVAEFQTQNGHPGTGVFDAETFADLIEAEKPPVIPDPEPEPDPEPDSPPDPEPDPDPDPEPEPDLPAPPVKTGTIVGLILLVLAFLGAIIFR